MSSHNEENHNSESKPISFTVPFLMACSLLIIIIMFLSLCDPKHGHQANCECKEDCSKECMEACEKGDHSMHPAATEAKAEESESAKETVATETLPDTLQKPAEAAKAEEPQH